MRRNPKMNEYEINEFITKMINDDGMSKGYAIK